MSKNHNRREQAETTTEIDVPVVQEVVASVEQELVVSAETSPSNEPAETPNETFQPVIHESMIVQDQAKAKQEEVSPEEQLINKVRQMSTKSSQIRYLNSLGWKNGPIAKFLSLIHGKQVIYQHVRNVLNQKLKSN